MSKVQMQESIIRNESSGGKQTLILPPSTPSGIGYQASLYLSYGILLTSEEFALLLASLDTIGDLSLFGTGVLLPQEKLVQSPSSLVEIYQNYLFPKEDPSLLPEHKAALSSVWSIDPEAVAFREIVHDKWQIVRQLPVIQLNRFQFRFDSKSDRFFTQSFSKETLFWGLEFRYPQLFLDPIHSKLIKALKAEYLNTSLWKGVHQWIRNNTMPVQFEGEGMKKRVAPFRIGNRAFDLGEEVLKRQNSHLKLKRPS